MGFSHFKLLVVIYTFSIKMCNSKYVFNGRENNTSLAKNGSEEKVPRTQQVKCIFFSKVNQYWLSKGFHLFD